MYMYMYVYIYIYLFIYLFSRDKIEVFIHYPLSAQWVS